MKLPSLASTTQHPTRESVERVRHADEQVRRVELMEGVEGDRQRSLQQELAEIEPPPSPRSKDRSRSCARPPKRRRNCWPWERRPMP